MNGFPHQSDVDERSVVETGRGDGYCSLISFVSWIGVTPKAHVKVPMTIPHYRGPGAEIPRVVRRTRHGQGRSLPLSGVWVPIALPAR